MLGAWAAAAGVALAYAARRSGRHRDVTADRAHAARTVTVRRDRPTLYGMWRDKRWTVDRGRGRTVDLTLVNDAPNERLTWHAEKLGPYAAHASVTFLDVGTRGTEVRLALALDGPTAKTAAAFARLFGDAPAQIAMESLRSFKAFAETGEIPKAVHD
jgi:uncharacterized membrane protein